ncbi:hypothetical protein CIHG_01548 [Coccidioides immitis H538.4]|uniref:Uncharacterized protein n=1 Tax=Coccidioides immitis H538.4 TaxID=396776 RepID=A0A0J8REY1_COCIT|nr:hypothetical protein CIHG_01548 [Coccidioides immitis H538.4]
MTQRSYSEVKQAVELKSCISPEPTRTHLLVDFQWGQAEISWPQLASPESLLGVIAPPGQGQGHRRPAAHAQRPDRPNAGVQNASKPPPWPQLTPPYPPLHTEREERSSGPSAGIVVESSLRSFIPRTKSQNHTQLRGSRSK